MINPGFQTVAIVTTRALAESRFEESQTALAGFMDRLGNEIAQAGSFADSYFAGQPKSGGFPGMPLRDLSDRNDWAFTTSYDDAEDQKRNDLFRKFLSDEFRIAYREDIDVLAKEALSNEFFLPIQSLCRGMLNLTVASVEHALHSVTLLSGAALFHPFLNQGGLSNQVKMKDFGRALQGAGVTPDQEVLDDFLAIKFLRNAYVHGSWKINQLSWLQSRGFPANLHQFDPSHWRKMQVTQAAMIDYILGAALFAMPDLHVILYRIPLLRALYESKTIPLQFS
ncbi:MAG TPA: hypothetical protein VLJ37_07705 [bacterium]|nr:hypothetical protein [bacterium]